MMSLAMCSNESCGRRASCLRSKEAASGGLERVVDFSPSSSGCVGFVSAKNVRMVPRRIPYKPAQFVSRMHKRNTRKVFC